MTCLDGLVGIFCPEGVPNADSPEYWVSELPGINLYNAVQMADPETFTGEALLEKAITFSKKIVVRDFVQRFRKGFTFLEIIGEEKIGRHGSGFLGTADQFTGTKYTLVDPSDRFVYGFVEYIELKIEDDAPGTVIYYQIDNQDPIDTFSIDLVKGYNRIELNIEFNEFARVWINNNSVSLSDGEQGISGSGSCRANCADYCGGCVYFDSISAPVAALDSIVWTETNTFNGFVGFVQCKGDPEELVCLYRKELATALLYRSGAYLMEEKSASSRNNPYIRNTRDESKELFARWMGGTDPLTGDHIIGEYPRAINQVVQNAIKFARRSNSKVFSPNSMIMGETVKSAVKIRGRRNIKPLKF